jgi:hypothetical protein
MPRVEKERVMEWEIDTKTKHLSLDGHYHISFDRLTEDDWFRHLSEKNWVDMTKILPAFVAAYDAAELKLDKDFFARHKESFFHRTESDYADGLMSVWSDKCNGGSSFLETASDLNNWIFTSNDSLIADLISREGPVDA